MKPYNNSILPLSNFNLISKFLLLLILFLLLLLILLSACKQPTQPKLEPKAELKLTLEDVSCTEAWIQLKTTNLQLPATLTLYKNNVAQNNILCYGDTLLYIDSLLPNQTYKFKVVITNNPQPTTYPQPPTSNEVTVTTMDTTSHEFSWQSWEFGECSNSVLYDVAIIDENNIWAVGEIYMRDSLGNCDPKAYNAVHWDGTKWELKRIIFYTFCPQGTGSGSYPATSIFALDNENIVISSGSQLAYLKNGIQIKKECIPVSVNKLWGSSSSDLYAVGNNGNIAHWDGVRWRKIESGTAIDLLDVWGSPNGTVWACGYTDDYDLSVFLKINGNNIEKYYEGKSNNIINGHYAGPIGGVWSYNDYRVLVMNWTGVLVQNNKFPYNPEKKIMNFVEPGFGIDGTLCNNVVVCGQRFVGHWNGYSYKEYPELISKPYRNLKSVSAKRNFFCVVGKDYNSPIFSNALIIIGKY